MIKTIFKILFAIIFVAKSAAAATGFSSPLPVEVKDIVGFVQLCSIYNRHNEAAHSDTSISPPLPETVANWGENNCDEEAIEAEVNRLLEKYKDDVFVQSALDSLPPYKD